MAGAPGGAALTNFDVQVHSRNNDTWYALESMPAQHGPACEKPSDPVAPTHENHTYEGAVFQCKDHLMTAIKAGGYGEIILTPNQVLDFATGGTVSWDLSTAKLSQRDFWDVWITPYADNLALPFDEGEVDLAGMPRNSVRVSTDSGEGAPLITVVRNGLSTTFNHGWDTAPAFADIVAGTDQSAVRQPYRITLSRTHLRVERMASTTGSAITFFDQDIADLGWSQGVVQFGHHSYNPEKCNDGTTTCGNRPNTWHWDNLTISPATPFTIIKADRRFIDDGAQTLTFAQPAPTGSMLRFSGIGSVQVSFDGGPFAPAQKQFATKNGDHPEHFSSYWTPAPAGARTVRFRFATDSWYQGPYMAKDFSFWSAGSFAAPAATTTATAALPTATPTQPATAAVPPTSSPTPAPTQPTTVPATATQAPKTTAPSTAPASPSPAAPATATPSPSPVAATWTTSASSSTAQPRRGRTMSVRASVKSSAAAQGLVDVEVYSPSGQRVYQKVFDNRSFTAGQVQRFDISYAVPAAGETGMYTVKIGVFKPSWGVMYAWNDSALQLSVR